MQVNTASQETQGRAARPGVGAVVVSGAQDCSISLAVVVTDSPIMECTIRTECRGKVTALTPSQSHQA
jgi:hypothetical protein